MSRAPILIMAGGTGGHVFPALAVARQLIAQDRAVVWLGSTRGIENRLIPAEGIPLERVRVAGLRGKGLLSWLLAPFKISIALWDALRVVRQCKPGAVLGMGGFAAGPGGVAAWLLRRPLVIHEQNAAAGLTNKLLARFAREVLEAFPGSFSASLKTRTIGNPVRAEITAIAEPDARLAGRRGPLRVLVLGGSQGALVLNKTVPQAAKLVENAGASDTAVPGSDNTLSGQPLLDIWHQAGEKTLADAEAAYREAGVTGRIEAFINDMGEAYAWADIVVCRAGALTVSELAAAGLGAVLVPFPAAVDDHQTMNAGYLVSADAAVLIPQSELSPQRLADELRCCVADRELVAARARRARELAKPSATDDLVQACLAVELAQ